MLGKIDHQMASLSRTSPFTEKISFQDCGTITISISLECSLVTSDDLKTETPKSASFFSKAAQIVKIGPTAEEKEAERVKQALVEAEKR